jgi:DNA-binding MarR family transcriptional regulator
MKTSTEIIKKQLIQVINKTIFKEKKKIFNFKGVSLYPSEVHLMLVIKNDIDTNATEIARQLGLTKGAISQTLSRLEKKGIIRKTKDPYKKNELTLSLTGFGKKAYEICQSSQASFIEAHEGFLAKLNSRETEVIFNFLLHMEKAIDDLDLS